MKRLTVMQVAARLQWKYSKARDKMLQGTFGEPIYEEGKLYVTEAGVIAFEQRKTEGG